jgi:hypothetical protein
LFEQGLKGALYSVENVFKPRIFRHTSLRNFLSKTLAELNPDLSLSAKTIDYYSELFVRYLFEKTCFDNWHITRNQVDYVGWPDALKMDHFMECAWNAQEFEHQLTFLYR